MPLLHPRHAIRAAARLDRCRHREGLQVHHRHVVVASDRDVGHAPAGRYQDALGGPAERDAPDDGTRRNLHDHQLARIEVGNEDVRAVRREPQAVRPLRERRSISDGR